MDDTIFSQFIEDTDIKVSISMFKSKFRVDIRKYYNDNGEQKPSPKGINMTVDEFKKLLVMIPELEDKISKL